MQKRKQVKNVNDLTADLLLTYNQVRDDEIGADAAKNAANVAGKIISNIKAKMEYNKMVGIKAPIEFMED